MGKLSLCVMLESGICAAGPFYFQLHKCSLQNQLSFPVPAIFREKVLFWIQLIKGKEENFPRNSGKRESGSARNQPRGTLGEAQIGDQELFYPRKAWKSLEWAAQAVVESLSMEIFPKKCGYGT